MVEIVETLLIACVPAIISGSVSFVLAKSQAKSETKKLQIENQHEIQKLMEQHKVDIDAIREQHRLEMESKEKDHQHRLEIMQKEHENELIRKESELENTAKYNAAGSIMTGLFNGMLGGAFNSPELQSEITKKILLLSDCDAVKDIQSLVWDYNSENQIIAENTYREDHSVTFDLETSSKNRCCNLLFIDEEIKASRNQVTSSRLHSTLEKDSGFQLWVLEL